MIFKINEESVFCCIVIFLVVFIRTIYFLIRNRKKFSSELFERKYLGAIFGKIFLGVAMCLFSLFYSNDFYILGLFFTWLLLILCCISLLFVLWIIFFMHGYDARYLFKKIILPCPMTFLEFFVILFTGIFTRNYFVIGLSLIYFLDSYMWDYKAYLLTKPKIPDYVVIRENDEE